MTWSVCNPDVVDVIVDQARNHRAALHVDHVRAIVECAGVGIQRREPPGLHEHR